jgi:hypothetical protein
MDSRDYKTAQRMNLLRAEIRSLTADVGRERMMHALLEAHAELSMDAALPPRAVYLNGPAGLTEVPAKVAPTPATGAVAGVKDEPAPDTLRADVLTVLRTSKVPMRTGDVVKAVTAIRPGANVPSIGSVIWNFAKEGRVLKQTVRGRHYYATDKAVLALLDDGFDFDDLGGPADDDGGDPV